ncbi:MAG: hypothetical protein R3F07_20660 [Opitutaceae bacterium]
MKTTETGSDRGAASIVTEDPRFHSDGIQRGRTGPGGVGEAGPEELFCEIGGERFIGVDCHRELKPFLVNVVSDDDHWMFVGSNGAITAGRKNPDEALFPYCNQDRLFDSTESTGGLTILRVRSDGRAEWKLWEPWSAIPSVDSKIQRRLFKNITGSRVIFEETNPDLGLRWRHHWSFSARHGIVRCCELSNTGPEGIEVQLLDGLRNILPYGLDEAFQARFSVLGDAYKSNELLVPEGIGLYSLSSLPSDRSEPNESLRASVAWSVGLEAHRILLSTEQVNAFRKGSTLLNETAIRGRRGAFLVASDGTLSPGEEMNWWTVADVGLSAADVTELVHRVRNTGEMASDLAAGIRATRDGLRRRVGSVDGIQSTHDELRCWRHFSNAMFNVMRGGMFEHGYSLPRADFLSRLQHFNPGIHRTHAAQLRQLPEQVDRRELIREVERIGDPDLRRLAGEYLPLSFSRRHGDPSRPWNRFSIDIRNADGSSRLAYQGNWRDIFQNWEALVHAYPEFIEATVLRFLNASTADGYNPYRITDRGIEWEVPDPNEPWSNIGYWGDHQIIYLLKLLETSRRFQPGRLQSLLDETFLVYTEVPYRIRPYADILKDPRNTVDFDRDAAARIAQRVASVGEDGKLLHRVDGDLCRVSLLEKLLVPLLAKLANFVPGGGIWMNTQRPEWNDANNALVGYGVSVVTLGYVHRYVLFLMELLEDPQVHPVHTLSAEVADWLRAQALVFSGLEVKKGDEASSNRREWLDRLGEMAGTYRAGLYERGLGGETREVPGSELASFLDRVGSVVRAALLENARGDGLFHAYNLLSFEPDGGVGLGRLGQMLEGQVSILSSGVLEPDEAAGLLDALRSSPLYREDQDSYLLYPDRILPGFMEKNRIAEGSAVLPGLLRSMLEAGDARIVTRDRNGDVRFNAAFHNVSDLRRALDLLWQSEWAGQVADERDSIEAVYESTFRHQAFTGRSGTFFAYEGLGSIYWHMVSKLILAIQENHRRALETGVDGRTVDRLARHYHASLAGLGIHRSPSRYGAFPTDAYSHTPAHAGAQQPGMTGQVKEDLLIRLGELGLNVSDGCLSFEPRLLRRAEFHRDPSVLEILDCQGAAQAVPLPAQSLGFTFCQVPVVYRAGEGPALELHQADGRIIQRESARLTRDESAAVFRRNCVVRKIVVRIPVDSLAD